MPDFTPPNPGIPQSFVDNVRACTHIVDATKSALIDSAGVVKRPCLVAANQCIEWAVSAQRNLVACDLTVDVYRCLLEGKLQTDGTILSDECFYKLACVRHPDGSLWIEQVKV